MPMPTRDRLKLARLRASTSWDPWPYPSFVEADAVRRAKRPIQDAFADQRVGYAGSSWELVYGLHPGTLVAVVLDERRARRT
jgi:hypothetical protein